MEMREIGAQLERIASALERIAALLEAGAKVQLPAASQEEKGAVSPLESGIEGKLEDLASTLARVVEDVSAPAAPAPDLEAEEIITPKLQLPRMPANPSERRAWGKQRAILKKIATLGEPWEGEEEGPALEEELPAEDEFSAIRYDLRLIYPQLCSYLQQRGLLLAEVNAPYEPRSLDQRIDSIAYYMGSNYRRLYPLLSAIKIHLASGSSFSIDLGKASTPSTKQMDTLGRALYEIGFLDEFKCWGYPDYKLQARAFNMGPIYNFFSGFWFERYIAQITERVVRQYMVESGLDLHTLEIVRNAKLVSGPKLRERDVLVLFGDRFYWIECKSGDYVDSIASYEQYAAHYRLPAENTFLVYLHEKPSYHRSSTSGMHICSSVAFPSKLREVLRASWQGKA